MYTSPAPFFTILLADDDADDRFFFKKALDELPDKYRFAEVHDGERLMTYLENNADNLPDVLFLDLNMPRKNGIECLVEIKENKAFKKLIMVICSTSLRDDVADSLYATGAHYYLHKCDYTELSKSIGHVLALLTESTAQPPRKGFIVNPQMA
jgi:CheY-like chemotaxis protein